MIDRQSHDYIVREKLQRRLQDGEVIEWAGQPDPSVHFSKADFLLIPFSLLWGGFAVVWEMGVLGLLFGGQGDRAPWFFALWGVPFVIIGLYMIFGRFIYKAARKKRTYYALTNKRAIVLTEGFGGGLESVFLDSVPAIHSLAGFKGTGNVVFGEGYGQIALYRNTGMWSGGIGGLVGPAFYDIHDYEHVYQVAVGLKNKLSR